MMKKIAIIFFVLIPVFAHAQGVRSFEARLGQESYAGGRIEVTEMGRAAAVTASLPTGDTERMVDGYRVEIFSDNSADARARAYEAYAKFRELCPDVVSDDATDIRYDSPKYTVRVGRYLTREEALVMCGRLKNVFKAYPRSEQFRLSVFAQPEPKPAEESELLDQPVHPREVLLHRAE
jgi:hypothetical protein